MAVATPPSSRQHEPADQGRARTAPPVVPPPRVRRRPALVAGSLVAVCVGALLSAYAYTSLSRAQDVVAARSTIARGAVITAQDLVTVRVGVDPALRTIPATRLASLFGRRAALDIGAGTLVTNDDVTDVVPPQVGMSLVGVALPAGALPSEPLRPGDRVRIVATPGAQGDAGQVAPAEIATTVLQVHPIDNGVTVVDVLVPHNSAALLAARVATGKVALVLDARES